MDTLLLRLHGYLAATHKALGIPFDPIADLIAAQDDEVVLHEVGETGVVAFIGDYCLLAWPPSEHFRARRQAWRLLEARLKLRGFTRHVVALANWRSMRVTRRIGAQSLGIDADGFVHMLLTYDNFLAGKAARRSEYTRPLETHDGQEIQAT